MSKCVQSSQQNANSITLNRAYAVPIYAPDPRYVAYINFILMFIFISYVLLYYAWYIKYLLPPIQYPNGLHLGLCCK